MPCFFPKDLEKSKIHDLLILIVVYFKYIYGIYYMPPHTE